MQYFFDLHDGSGWARDDFGMNCQDDVGARRQAVLALVEMARDYIPSDGAFMSLTVRTRNTVQVAFTVRLNFSTEGGPGLSDPSILQSHG